MDRKYLFYELMKYPVPIEQGIFAYGGDTEITDIGAGFSRDEECELLDKYRNTINKYRWLWASLPFIESIYLCNSISFNSLKSGSDIDLFFVVKDGRMRQARWWSTVLFLILGIKRIASRVSQKFCLSFYVTESYTDLQTIRLTPYDPYLVYWLAHLAPLYHERLDDPTDIYHDNQWLSEYLPNHPMKHVIDLGIPTYNGSTYFKQFIEKRGGGWFGDIFELLIRLLWLPILFWKKHRLGAMGETIILSDYMLKFYADQRQVIATKWKVAQK